MPLVFFGCLLYQNIRTILLSVFSIHVKLINCDMLESNVLRQPQCINHGVFVEVSPESLTTSQPITTVLPPNVTFVVNGTEQPSGITPGKMNDIFCKS